MKRAVLKRTSICLAATVVLCTSSIVNTKAVSFTGEIGVAGIELSLGDNSSARNVVRDSEVVGVLSARMVGEEAAITDNDEKTTEDIESDLTDDVKSDDSEAEDVKERRS